VDSMGSGPFPAANSGSPSDVNVWGALAGKQLGDFQLIRLLGAGGMGEVYLARQLSLDRTVAVKVLDPVRNQDPTAELRFDREARAAAALSHPNIVQIIDYGRQEGTLYLALEYVRGCTLREYVERNGPLPVRTVLGILTQVAMALDHAHRRGLVHRDIKPENILISRDGLVKVADFGLARVAVDENVHLTRTGTALGTPLYMSPEQIRGHKVDARSDLYSLGVTAYFMLTGHPPFEGDNALTVALRHLEEDAPAIRAVRADVPPELDRVVRRLLEKDPARRYSSAAELLDELRELAAQDGMQSSAGVLSMVPLERTAGDGRPGGWPFRTLPYWSRYTAVIVVGVLAFILGAVLLPPKIDISTASQTTAAGLRPADLSRFATADEAIRYARSLGRSEAAVATWYGILRRFGENRFATLTAAAYLVYLCGVRGQTEQARLVLEEVDWDRIEGGRLVRRLLEACVLAYEDRPEESLQLLHELSRELPVIPDVSLANVVAHAVERNLFNTGASSPDRTLYRWIRDSIRRLGPTPPNLRPFRGRPRRGPRSPNRPLGVTRVGWACVLAV